MGIGFLAVGWAVVVTIGVVIEELLCFEMEETVGGEKLKIERIVETLELKVDGISRSESEKAGLGVGLRNSGTITGPTPKGSIFEDISPLIASAW